MARKPEVPRSTDQPGGVLATAAAHERFVQRVGLGWIGVVEALGRLHAEDHVVYRVTVRGDWDGHGEFLLVLIADTENGPKVAFHNSGDPHGMWVSLKNRIENGSLKWKDDEYAKS